MGIWNGLGSDAKDWAGRRNQQMYVSINLALANYLFVLFPKKRKLMI